MSGRQGTGARRTGDRTSVAATSAPPATGTTAPADTAAPAAPPVKPLIPTQAGHLVSAPVPVVPARVVLAPTAATTEPSASELPVAESPAPARARAPQVVALLTAAAVLISAGGVWAVQQERGERADARRAAQARVDGAYLALAPELATGRVDGLVAGTAVVTALRADASATGRAAVGRAAATLAASAQAGDAPRGALQAAIDGATGALDAPAVSLTSLRTANAALAGPEKAVVDAQAAWQAAEDARIAAEAAAAQAAAQAAAARDAARGSSKSGTTRRATSAGTATRAGTRTGGSAGAVAAPAAAGLPTAGSEASSGDVGAALNAHRAANGLGGLSIVRSGARVEHAMQMAASNSIWHSGTGAEIVGRVSPGNATRMIAAYAASVDHNKLMLRGYSTAYIGAVSYDGWLYTSITFG
ncbi:hypothetical protein [Cellulomonas xiejunii]|uniref:SCP domain-containing protein n=1 Tax=Cellulomonas xiejunii TaxID=2968083 RepID=A0ABY5KRZ9_9CELL|nr:hypothetical protein [Cellulomonas xiejunii]MCC2315629.1 hypothetical protein [Cellulomonas xiejunii]MCC2322595.1 hypothetical protein [Cellulomonas xiejunii]UUI72628.1 hypothetical protein NP048_03995 [Cellulomonas xiejunii]